MQNQLMVVETEYNAYQMERWDVAAYNMPDEELRTRLKTHLRNERQNQAKFLAHLCEFDRRMLFASEGYGSLRAYCVEELGLSENSAGKRVHVAGLVRKCPLVLDYIYREQVSLTALSRLAPYMDTENQAELLEMASRKSVRYVEQALAVRFPDYVSAKETLQKIRFLSSERVEITFTADRAFVDKLEHATALSLHDCPTGRMADVLGKGLDMIVRKKDRAKKPCRSGNASPETEENMSRDISDETCKSMSRDIPIETGMSTSRDMSLRAKRRNLSEIASATSSPRNDRSRYIPERVKRDVWSRDSGKCTYQATNGRVCGSRAKIEFDHIQPFALGGEHSARNVRLLCRTHNKLAQKEAFDDRWT